MEELENFIKRVRDYFYYREDFRVQDIIKEYFLLEALEKISALNYGFGLAKHKKFFFNKPIDELMQEKKIRKPVFSDYYSLLISEGKSELEELHREREPHIIDWALDYKKSFNFFEMGYQFSEDQEEFELELRVLNVLFQAITAEDILDSPFATCQDIAPSLPEADDPMVELVIMKAIFHAGKMIERLKYEGQERSDKPVKAGSSPKKSRYSDQDIIEAFYKCNGKNLHAMALEIEAFLEDHKKKSKSTKTVPSISTIKRVLKKEDLDKKLSK